MKNTVLIVDDNQAVLSALSQLLEYEVEKVIGIKSPSLIPWIMETQDVDVIIMDMNFSRGATDGKEGITWLKRILQDDPIYLLSLDNPWNQSGRFNTDHLLNFVFKKLTQGRKYCLIIIYYEYSIFQIVLF